MTEPRAGPDISAISTRAVPERSGFRLHGAKALGTNAPIAEVAIVFGATGADAGPRAGLWAFLVETESVRPADLQVSSGAAQDPST